MWVSAADALHRLGVKQQTLYANVSRGRIAARPDPADPRRSLYNSEDIDRIARRRPGRRATGSVAAEAISWGEPVLPSAISTIRNGRLLYRGRDAGDLSRSATLEDVASLLWDGLPGPVAVSGVEQGSLRAAFAGLANETALAAPSLHRTPASLRGDAARVLAILASGLLGAGDEALHIRLAACFGRRDAADDLRCALVLLADHELNASTFAARVAVSTGASLAAGALAGLATLTGPLHGHTSQALTALADEFGDADRDPAETLREWLGEGRFVPGFGHRLYPKGDPRAAVLLDRLALSGAYRRLLAAAEAVIGEAPNVDFALAALAARYDLPASAPMTIFALARAVGWLAHMLEQAETGALIRPRARYVGVVPPVT